MNITLTTSGEIKRVVKNGKTTILDSDIHILGNVGDFDINGRSTAGRKHRQPDTKIGDVLSLTRNSSHESLAIDIDLKGRPQVNTDWQGQLSFERQKVPADILVLAQQNGAKIHAGRFVLSGNHPENYVAITQGPNCPDGNIEVVLIE